MIEVEHVSKIYGKKQNTFAALKDVTFKIPSGATVAIVGKSGSGKSTLMHLMSGLDKPSEGNIAVGGNNIHRLKRKAMDKFRAEEMGFIFQSFFVEGNQSCYYNVSLPLEIKGVPRKKRKALIEKALKQVDLADKISSKAKNLSGGQKQRLAIARAIVNEPNYIFADEPTGNLDSNTGEKVVDLLFNLNKRLGVTLCIVTHDEELASRCQLQLTLKDGEVVGFKQNRKSAAPEKKPVKRAVRRRVV